jgi:hypothetical protein
MTSSRMTTSIYIAARFRVNRGSRFLGFQTRITVLDRRSWDLEVVVVRRTINLGTGNLEWGGNGEGLRKERSVYE